MLDPDYDGLPPELRSIEYCAFKSCFIHAHSALFQKGFKSQNFELMFFRESMEIFK